MALFELIEKSVVKTPLKSKNKKDVIKEMVEILHKAGKVKDVKTALKDLYEREELSSTGLGNGIAIPHAKTLAVNTLTIAIGLSPKGIEFDSLDDLPANYFFLILAAPDQSSPHLQALTEIARLTRDQEFCQELLKSSNSADVVKLFARESF
jgi:fructose-specific phosphotransferase system IIA component